MARTLPAGGADEIAHNAAMTQKPLDLSALDAAIVDLDGTLVDTVGSPAVNHGFAVAIAEVTFWGLCPACQLQPQTL